MLSRIAWRAAKSKVCVPNLSRRKESVHCKCLPARESGTTGGDFPQGRVVTLAYQYASSCLIASPRPSRSMSTRSRSDPRHQGDSVLVELQGGLPGREDAVTNGISSRRGLREEGKVQVPLLSQL